MAIGNCVEHWTSELIPRCERASKFIVARYRSDPALTPEQLWNEYLFECYPPFPYGHLGQEERENARLEDIKKLVLWAETVRTPDGQVPAPPGLLAQVKEFGVSGLVPKQVFLTLAASDLRPVEGVRILIHTPLTVARQYASAICGETYDEQTSAPQVEARTNRFVGQTKSRQAGLVASPVERVVEAATGYLQRLPQQARAAVEAERLKARRQLEQRRKKAPWNKWGPAREDEENFRKYVLRVFRVFAREVCRLGLEGTWTAEDIQRSADEFLRRFTIAAYYDDGHTNDGGKLRSMTSHWNGTLLPEVDQEYRKSAEWRRYERNLLAVAEAQSKPHIQAHASPPEAAGGTCAQKRRAAVEAYIDEVFRETGTRITRAEIWRHARYKSRTVFECWERCDPKRPNKVADERFKTILREKPHLK